MIEVLNICKKYGKHCILDDVSFTIHKGDCIGIIGANGSGKSTLLSILSGALKADSGQFLINGKNAFRHSELLHNLIGYVPQENPLINELTVLDNLRLWYCNSPVGLKKELEEGVLKNLALEKILKKEAGKLSGGMKKRVSIGIALSGHPPILILDEPGTALDIPCKHDINRYLAHYLEIGGTILITTHDKDEIALCNRIFLMENHSLKPISPDVKNVENELMKGMVYENE